MDVVEVPTYFLCPISWEIMRDPVTLSTGISYDRENIERWIFSFGTGKQATCPVTKQVLPLHNSDDLLVTPNITLRRLIQAWCTVNASSAGVERLPTPRAPVTSADIAGLIGSDDPEVMKKIREIVAESERNRRCAIAAGVIPFLASVIRRSAAADFARAIDEALSILHYLRLTDDEILNLIEANDDIISDLAGVMKSGSYHSRIYATQMLSLIFSVISPARLVTVQEQVYNELIRIITERLLEKATKAAVKSLGRLVPWGRNRIKAAKAGGVTAIVDLLLDTNERRLSELALQVLDVICKCAEGRAEFIKHPGGIAVVSKKVLRVSPAASDRAVRVLHSVAKWSPAPAAVAAEMLQVGAVSKLLLVVQVDCGTKIKEKAKEMLRLNSRVWKNSPCLSPHLLGSYPSSSS